MSERPIFIVGSPRSGTTLLRDLLRSHPRLTFPPESYLLPVLFRLHGDPTSARRAYQLARDLLGSFSIAEWGLDLGPGDLEQNRSFAALVSALFAAWARREGKPRWGDKTPRYARELPLLLTLFPEAQVVHVLRDGRDVACSLIRQPWGPTTVFTAAEMWRSCVEPGIRDGRRLGPDRYLEVSFEQLVAAPEPVLRRLCDFVGEDFHPAMLTPSRITPPRGLPPPWPASLERRIDPGVVGRWQSELNDSGQAVFEAVAGEALRRLGYASDAKGRAPSRIARASYRARDLAGFVRWRATTWDRLPRLRTDLLLARARLERRLGLIGGAGSDGGASIEAVPER
jgi:hypothetical protein